MPVPKGTRIGGRQRGTPNKKTAEMRDELERGGELPLDFLLRVMRTSADEARAIDAAKAAAPFVHARLASVDVGNKDDKPFEQVMRWANSVEEATPDPSKR